MVARAGPLASEPPGTASRGLSQPAYEALTQGIVVLAADGRIVQSNPAARRILGFTADQISGRTPRDAGWRTIREDGSEFPGECHPGTVALATGEPVLGVTMGLRRRDGSVTWILVNAVPLASSAEPEDGAVVVTFTDISKQVDIVDDLRSTRAELAESEERYRLLAENASDVVFHIKDGIIRWVSPSLSHALGWAPEDWVGAEGRGFLHPDDLADLGAHRDSLMAGRSVITRRRVRAKDGRYHWVEANARAFIGADGERQGVLTSFRLADSQVDAERQLVHAAEHDGLTGLLTGSALLTKLEPHRVPAQGSHAGVLFCDIDGFKATNDEFGHAIGDAVLRVVAARVTGALRVNDLVSRYGGDEIVALLVNVADEAEAEHLAERVRRATSDPIVVDGRTVVITTSVGVTLTRRGEHIEDVIARADGAMYAAKGYGKNRVVLL